MYSSRGNIRGKSLRPPSFTVFIYHDDSRVEGRKRFTDPVKANDYFEELCGTRSAEPASVVGVSRHDIKKYFRIDQVYDLNRVLLDLEWVSIE
jgi:hypothetical protein